jgi:hypothetical protein
LKNNTTFKYETFLIFSFGLDPSSKKQKKRKEPVANEKETRHRPFATKSFSKMEFQPDLKITFTNLDPSHKIISI